MQILQLKAARGWSCTQAAQVLMLDEQTLKSWMRRIDEEGQSALIRLSEPHLGATTVERILRETQPIPEEMACPITITTQRDRSTPGGSVAHRFDRGTHRGGILAAVGLEIFGCTPAAEGVRRAVSQAIRRVGRPPRYVITDRGRHFRSGTWARLCRAHRIRPRFAVGKHGSIAIVERLIRTMKVECTMRPPHRHSRR